MDLQIQAEEADTSTYVLNGEWALLGMWLGENIHNLCQYTPTTTQQHFAERQFLSYASSLSFYKESDMLYSNGHDYDFTLLYIYTWIYISV